MIVLAILLSLVVAALAVALYRERVENAKQVKAADKVMAYLTKVESTYMNTATELGFSNHTTNASNSEDNLWVNPFE